MRKKLTPIRFVGLVLLLEWLIIVFWHFPWAVDRPVDRDAEQKAFYATAYAAPKPQTESEKLREQRYVEVAQRAAKIFNVEGLIGDFVSAYGLSDKRVLDVGSGRGHLQDMVQDYTGLDISPTAARFYHKRFVLGSATAMPFKDAEFDAAWSVFVLEHIPNPEAALLEIRRVLKPGAVLFLMPAWNCQPWLADGYTVRPYSDFGVRGKLLKASLPIRESPAFQFTYTIPIRILRLASARLGGVTRLRYRRLDPNYSDYWVPDSDAATSLDPMETILWFESRGDKCLNCPTGWQYVKTPPAVPIIRVNHQNN